MSDSIILPFEPGPIVAPHDFDGATKARGLMVQAHVATLDGEPVPMVVFRFFVGDDFAPPIYLATDDEHMAALPDIISRTITAARTAAANPENTGPRL